MPHGLACKILVPRPGIEPVLSAVEAWSLNHWTTREVFFFFKLHFPKQKELSKKDNFVLRFCKSH